MAQELKSDAKSPRVRAESIRDPFFACLSHQFVLCDKKKKFANSFELLVESHENVIKGPQSCMSGNKKSHWLRVL